MEVIRIAGYVFEEKMAILKRHLLPEVLSESCIPPSSGEIPDDVLRELITSYTREAGVRSLKKYVEQIYRKIALTMVRGGTESRGSRAPEPITRSTLEKFCGIPAYATERLYEQTPPGVVMGLAWTSLGGVSLFVETLAQQPEREGGGAAVRITGQIGQVMTESSQIAHTYARRFLAEQGRDYLENVAVHMHIPEGATPKDGPSAGITMVTALVSLALGQAVAKDIAMTGEVTLTGRVLKVGGIKEKTIAARRDHATVLILPQQNQREYDELKPHHKYGLTAHFVEYYDDIANLIFGIPTPRGTVVTVHPPAREPDRAPTGAKKK
jgi:endopeptidase La